MEYFFSCLFKGRITDNLECAPIRNAISSLQWYITLWIYPEPRETQMILGFNASQILDIQNTSLFIIACSSFTCYLYYNLAPVFYGNDGEYTKPFHMLLPFVGLHAVIDFFINKSYDIKFHHFCIFGIMLYDIYYNISLEDRFIFLYPLLKTEISSIFYVLKEWLPKKTVLYNINSLLFLVSFIKFRLYDYYYEIIYNNIYFDIIFQKYSPHNYYLPAISLASCYGLYILNLYWFSIIIKILYKTMVKIVHINTDIICHQICSYLYFINIPLSIYIYMYNPNEKYIFDIFGIGVLCISSYNYHYDIYTRLYDKTIEEYTVPNKDNIILCLNDSIAIHLRSFLVILTNYYNHPYLLYVLCISGIFHISSIYQCILNIFTNLYTNNNDKNFMNIHNIMFIIPISYDVLSVFINSPNEIAIPYLFVNIAICILFLIEPFYKLTHIAFHILLLLQTYYMCLSNTHYLNAYSV